MSKNELKPCPFCGSHSHGWHKQYNHEVERNGMLYQIFCRRCGAACRSKKTEAEAITAWNTRPSPDTKPDVAETVDAVAEAEEHLHHGIMSYKTGATITALIELAQEQGKQLAEAKAENKRLRDGLERICNLSTDKAMEYGGGVRAYRYYAAKLLAGESSPLPRQRGVNDE